MDKKWKKKAISLSLATTMTIGAPMVFLGCDDVVVDKVGTENPKDDAYHGTGATPFVFPEEESQSKVGVQNGGGYSVFMYRTSSWRVWQDAQNDNNSSYSSSGGGGGHSGGYSSYIRASSSS